jgi:hypothetical protein
MKIMWRSLLILLGIGFSLSSHAAINLQCINIDSGNGALGLTISDNVQDVQVAVINASGAEEGSGLLNCEGPIASAYSCTGQISDLKIASSTLIIPQSLFQASPPEGIVSFNSTQFSCK